MPLPLHARIAQPAEHAPLKRLVESSNLSSCTTLEGGVIGNSGRSERPVPGSNPGRPDLWLSYNGGTSRITRDCDSRDESSILSSHPTNQKKERDNSNNQRSAQTTNSRSENKTIYGVMEKARGYSPRDKFVNQKEVLKSKTS